MNIIVLIKEYIEQLGIVNQVQIGDVFEVNNKADVQYPLIVLDLETILARVEDIRPTFKMYYVDRIQSDKDNAQEIQMDSGYVLNSIISALGDNIRVLNESSMITTFKQRFSDMCAGGFVDIEVEQCVLEGGTPEFVIPKPGLLPALYVQYGDGTLEEYLNNLSPGGIIVTDETLKGEGTEESPLGLNVEIPTDHNELINRNVIGAHNGDAVSIDSSGFTTLDASINTVQKLAEAVDEFSILPKHLLTIVVDEAVDSIIVTEDKNGNSLNLTKYLHLSTDIFFEQNNRVYLRLNGVTDSVYNYSTVTTGVVVLLGANVLVQRGEIELNLKGVNGYTGKSIFNVQAYGHSSSFNFTPITSIEITRTVAGNIPIGSKIYIYGE